MDPSSKPIKYLAILQIKPAKFFSLHEAGKYNMIIELLKDALQERTKLWSGLGDEDLDLLAVHEAYQYLSRTFVDDAAKNTVANQQGTVMSIKEINAKFQKGELWSTMYIDSKKLESTPKEEANDPPKVNNDFNKRKSISNLKFTNAVRRNTKAVIATKNLEPELPKKEEMLTMQIIPKKGLAKSSSESRLKVKFDTPPGSAKNSISESIKSSKKNSRKKLLKSASESRLKIIEWEKLEGTTFIESRRGNKSFKDELAEIKKETLTVPKKLPKSASESSFSKVDMNEANKAVHKKRLSSASIKNVKKDTSDNVPMTKSASESRIPQLRRDSHESITSEDDQDFPPTLNFPENLKFDFHEEISRRLYNVNSQGGPPTQKEAKRMARTLKWMGQLQSIQ